MRKSIEKCVGGFFILLKMMSSLVTARVSMIDLSLTKARALALRLSFSEGAA